MTLHKDGICIDVDECELNEHDCNGERENCVNLASGFECRCHTGWQDNGFNTCVNLNECITGFHECADGRATCEV